MSIADFQPVRVLKVCLTAKLRRPKLFHNSPGNFLRNVRYKVKPADEPGSLAPLVYFGRARTFRVRAFSVASLGAHRFGEADEGTSELVLKDYATRSRCLPAQLARRSSCDCGGSEREGKRMLRQRGAVVIRGREWGS